RRTVEVMTVYGPARVKLAERPDGRTTAKPEYDDCARLAREKDVPIADVFRAAARAAEAHAATLPPGGRHGPGHGRGRPPRHPHDGEHPGHPHALGVDADEVDEPEHP